MIPVPAEPRHESQLYSFPPQIPRRQNQRPPVTPHEGKLPSHPRIVRQYLVDVGARFEQFFCHRWYHQGDFRPGNPVPELPQQRGRQYRIADVVQSDDEYGPDFFRPGRSCAPETEQPEQRLTDSDGESRARQPRRESIDKPPQDTQHALQPVSGVLRLKCSRPGS